MLTEINDTMTPARSSKGRHTTGVRYPADRVRSSFRTLQAGTWMALTLTMLPLTTSAVPPPLELRKFK